MSPATARCPADAKRDTHQLREQSVSREKSISSSSSFSFGRRHWKKDQWTEQGWKEDQWTANLKANSSHPRLVMLLWHSFTDGCACNARQDILGIIISENILGLLTLNLHRVQWNTGLHINIRCPSVLKWVTSVGWFVSSGYFPQETQCSARYDVRRAGIFKQQNLKSWHCYCFLSLAWFTSTKVLNHCWE